VISAPEGDIDTASDGFADNSRLFLPATSFHRFAVTREINDGLLRPPLRAESARLAFGRSLVAVDPVKPASKAGTATTVT